MINKIFSECNSRGDIIELYQCAATDKIYTRLEGSLIWPGKEKGFVCIIGESIEKRENNERRPLEVLHENHASSLVDLARQCIALQKHFFVDRWLTDIQGDNFLFADKFYDLGREQDVALDAYQERLPQNMDIAIQVLSQRFHENCLTVSVAGVLADRLQALNNEDPKQSDLYKKYSEVFALASMVHFFDQFPFDGFDEDPDDWRNDMPEDTGRSKICGY